MLVGGVSTARLAPTVIASSVAGLHPYSTLVVAAALVFRNQRREKDVTACRPRRLFADLSVSFMSRILVPGFLKWGNSLQK